MACKPIICTSSYLRTSSYTQDVAKELFSALNSIGIEHMEISNTCDYWCRDYMPISLFDDGSYARYEYKPGYLWDKENYHKYITNQSDALSRFNIWTPSDMKIVFDGGNYVRCNDKVLMTDKILMENTHWALHVLFEHLRMSVMGDIVLIPWDMDDPCGHADGIVAPLPDGRLLVNNYCQIARGKKKAYYKRLLKMLEPHFDLVELSYDCNHEKNSWCYLNFLRVGNAILLPCLTKNAECDNDQAAIELFKNLFPTYKIIPIYAYPLIKRGGALHCITWEYYTPPTNQNG